MNKKILIVDDSRVSRMMMRSLLGNQRPNWEIAEAAHGEEALKLAEKTNFDVFSLDLNMPGMDGMTLLRRVKAQQTTRYLPFIMLTTEDSEQIKREGFEAGARVWLTKPFEPLKLLDDVCKVVQP